MSSTYIEIVAVQRPFEFNVDDNGRVMFSCNFDALAQAPTDDWEQEIVQVLEDAGLATSGTDTFIGSEAALPTGKGPYIQILDSGGGPLMEAHDGNDYERLSVQIVVRADAYTTARTRALAIWRELHGKRDVTVTAA